jgi:hypothetical protein
MLALGHKRTSVIKGLAAGAFTDNPFISPGSFSLDRTGLSRRLCSRARVFVQI